MVSHKFNISPYSPLMLVRLETLRFSVCFWFLLPVNLPGPEFKAKGRCCDARPLTKKPFSSFRTISMIGQFTDDTPKRFETSDSAACITTWGFIV